MTKMYIENLDTEKTRKIRIFQLTETGGFDAVSANIKPMDVLNASIGISLAPYEECQGIVNRAGALIPIVNIRATTKHFESFGYKVDSLSRWTGSNIKCVGSYNSFETLYVYEEYPVDVYVDNELVLQNFKFDYGSGGYNNQYIRDILLEKELRLDFFEDLN